MSLPGYATHELSEKSAINGLNTWKYKCSFSYRENKERKIQNGIKN